MPPSYFIFSSCSVHTRSSMYCYLFLRYMHLSHFRSLVLAVPLAWREKLTFVGLSPFHSNFSSNYHHFTEFFPVTPQHFFYSTDICDIIFLFAYWLWISAPPCQWLAVFTSLYSQGFQQWLPPGRQSIDSCWLSEWMTSRILHSF